MGVWCVVCVMVLQRVDERRAAERATVPSSPSGLLAGCWLNLTASQPAATSGGKQERLAGSAAPSQR